MNAFDYRAPRTVDEALMTLHEHGEDARVIAGGTALVTMMRQHLVRPTCLVSLRDVEGLGGIEAPDGAVRIGALVTLRDLEVSPLVRERLPVLAETCRRVATVRIRHMATLGGGLAHGDPNQDPPVTLIALGATVATRRRSGQREVPLDAFFRDYYETVLEPGELVTGVTIPLPAAGRGTAFVKFLPRTADDYATVVVAATVTLDADGGRCRDARIALGAVGVTPLRARTAEAIVAGERIDEDVRRAAAEAVKGEVDPVSDHRGSAAYKREMAGVMVSRALAQAEELARDATRALR